MHSKAMITLLAAMAAANVLALTPSQMAKLRKMSERPAIVGRDTTSVPGVIIEHWDPPYINELGEAEYYRTNTVVSIVGKKQPTTWSQVKDALEKHADEAEADAKKTRDLQKAAKKAGKNLDKIVKMIKKARDKSTTPEETELYQLLLDIINA